MSPRVTHPDDDLVYACAACDSTDLTKRNLPGRAEKSPGKRYRCRNCGHAVDQLPEPRESQSSGSGGRGGAKYAHLAGAIDPDPSQSLRDQLDDIRPAKHRVGDIVAHLDCHADVSERAVAIATAADDHDDIERHPRTVAAAAVYVATREHHSDLSQREIAAASECSRASIGDAYEEVAAAARHDDPERVAAAHEFEPASLRDGERPEMDGHARRNLAAIREHVRAGHLDEAAYERALSRATGGEQA